MNLQHWIIQARDHWKEHRPTYFKELIRAGTLDEALREGAEATHREMSDLEEVGYSNQEAWEMIRENYLFLPPEEVPETELNQAALLFNELIALQNKILCGDEFEEY